MKNTEKQQPEKKWILAQSEDEGMYVRRIDLFFAVRGCIMGIIGQP